MRPGVRSAASLRASLRVWSCWSASRTSRSCAIRDRARTGPYANVVYGSTRAATGGSARCHAGVKRDCGVLGASSRAALSRPAAGAAAHAGRKPGPSPS
eukprot:874403-Prymnesium_polylepis.1